MTQVPRGVTARAPTATARPPPHARTNRRVCPNDRMSSASTSEICRAGDSGLARKSAIPQARAKAASVSVGLGTLAIPPLRTCMPSPCATMVTTSGSRKRLSWGYSMQMKLRPLEAPPPSPLVAARERGGVSGPPHTGGRSRKTVAPRSAYFWRRSGVPFRKQRAVWVPFTVAATALTHSSTDP